MEQQIEKLSGLYLDFLSKSSQEISQKNSSNVLISFATEISGELYTENFDSYFSTYEKVFYWAKPEEEITIFGFDDLITVAENGINRFKVTEKKIKQAKEFFVSNWKSVGLPFLPLFLGGMKFTPDKDDNLWSNFDDTLWFIPKFLFVTTGKKTYFIFNYYLNSTFSVNLAVDKFKTKLKYIFFPNCKVENYIQPKIIQISENSPKDKKKWLEKVKFGINEIKNGNIRKVVLSRKIDITLTGKPLISELLTALKDKYPNCTVFAYHSGKSIFFGASPERLAKFQDNFVEIDALAGSARRGSDESEENEISQKLLSDEKELDEHNIVVSYLKEQLSGVTENIEFPGSPQIKKLANIQHLWTPIKAVLSENKSILSVIELIHPTPALGGLPKEKALTIIKKSEDYNRGLYTGIIGWLTPDNEGEFTAAIRSALINGKKITAFAGCGIVEHSIPENEFTETELKLNAILSLFK